MLGVSHEAFLIQAIMALPGSTMMKLTRSISSSLSLSLSLSDFCAFILYFFQKWGYNRAASPKRHAQLFPCTTMPRLQPSSAPGHRPAGSRAKRECSLLAISPSPPLLCCGPIARGSLSTQTLPFNGCTGVEQKKHLPFPSVLSSPQRYY